jgi:hypothetical protein
MSIEPGIDNSGVAWSCCVAKLDGVCGGTLGDELGPLFRSAHVLPIAERVGTPLSPIILCRSSAIICRDAFSSVTLAFEPYIRTRSELNPEIRSVVGLVAESVSNDWLSLLCLLSHIYVENPCQAEPASTLNLLPLCHNIRMEIS